MLRDGADGGTLTQPMVGTLGDTIMAWASGQGSSTVHTAHSERGNRQRGYSTLGCSTEGPCARRPVPTGGCRERRKRTDRWAVWAVEERASSEAERECPVYF